MRLMYTCLLRNRNHPENTKQTLMLKKEKVNRLFVVKSPYCGMKVCTWPVELFIINPHTGDDCLCHYWQSAGFKASIWLTRLFRFAAQFDHELQYVDSVEGPEWCAYTICWQQKCLTGNLWCSKKITPFIVRLFYAIQATTGFHSELAKENAEASHIKSPYWHQPINQNIYLIV